MSTSAVPVIHCHSQSDKNTTGFITFMWETLRGLANHPEALRLSVHCMGPTARDKLSSLPNTRTFHVPDGTITGGLVGSTGHAQCVEHALRQTDDGDIHLIMDADTVVLAKGWDDYVRLQLLDEKVGTFGTTYEDVGGTTSGSGTVQTYKRIPNVVWMALSPLHSWRGLKALPDKGSNIHVADEPQSKIYNLPVGYQVLRDVAWQIPQYLADHRISYRAWPQLKGSGGAVVIKGLSDYHEEYHVEADIPFVVHHRGSMRHPYRGDGLSRSFYEKVDAYLTLERAMGPRWRWEPTEANLEVRTTLAATREAAGPRIEEFDKEATLPDPPPVVPATVPIEPIGIGGAVAVPPHEPGQPALNGWLKATVDGANVWSRYASPVPKQIALTFTPDNITKHVRLEGTVDGLIVNVPPAPTRPHTLTVRNMTTGKVIVQSYPGTKAVEIDVGRCMLVLTDVDGVVQVG